jgi:hypothetical protein
LPGPALGYSATPDHGQNPWSGSRDDKQLTALALAV